MVPDIDAFLAANKALLVIFIILISLANLGLIVKQVRKPLFYQNVKAMIISSLAIGDLLFALFPLVVMADIIFRMSLLSMACRLLTASATYLNYLIHFVYGIGLVTLGAEVLLRHRIYALNIHKGIIALFASSIPWILGLVVILPLCLAKVDFEITCENSQSSESMYGVSVIFPASLAVVVTVILSCINFSKQDSKQFTNPNQPQVVYQQKPPSIQQQNVPYTNHEQPPKHLHLNEKGQNPSCQVGVYPNPSNKSEVYQYPSNQPGVYQYPPEVYPYPINQHQTDSMLVGNNQTTNTAAVSLSNRRTEIQRLLIIAIVFFILVMPVAGLALNVDTIVWPDSMTAVAVSQFFYWLMVFRSFLTPLIMLNYSDL